MSFYSNAAGSGGNVSWNVTLPEDQSATANQSDLYAAAWFGLVVSDPAGWLGQCYIEIQLYPDFNWNFPSTTVSGNWSGAVVGWQVNPASGAVDTCFYTPLYVTGHPGDYFSMNQGDNLSLRLFGWTKDPTGENVTLTDATSGVTASVNLFNATGGFPLDPAYLTNAFASSLLWTTGGQLPISFGFEIGRAGHPGGVTNNGLGGCNPGAGNPKPKNPSVPCPSYDPLSWVNDTLSPWQIGVPTFYAGASQTTPTQVSFSSSVGASIYDLSNGTCLNRVGSSYCTYPWFGFTCTEGTFTVGAADFPGESNDFGQWAEYPVTSGQNLLGFATYSPLNFSTPNCGGAGATVTVGTSGGIGGAVDFLSDVNRTYSIGGVSFGTYSLAALPPAGAGFAGWTVTGSLSVGTASSPSTTLHVFGSGTVSAAFTLTPHQTQVWFNSTTIGSAVVVTPGQFFTNTTFPTTVPAGTSISLAPGVYGIQASPARDTSFARWAVSSGATGGTLASPTLPVSWLIVTGETSQVGIGVTYTASTGRVTVLLAGFGDGTVSLNGTSTGAYNAGTGFSGATVSLSPGTFPAVAVAAPGWTFLGWTYNVSATMVNFNNSTTVSFLAGNASLTANFGADVTTLVSPVSAGDIAFNDIGPMANDTVSTVLRGSYDLDALPHGFQRFSTWQVSNPTNLSVSLPAYPVTHVLVNGPGTITVVYTVAANLSLTFDNGPSAGGSIVFNFQTITGASTVNASLATGAYLVSYVPNAGWQINGSRPWTLTGPITLPAGTGILTVSGTGGVLTANWVQIGYPVSFVTASGANVSALFGGRAVPVHSGGTLTLAAASYSLTAEIGPNATFVRWLGSHDVDPDNDLLPTTNVTVRGAGTLFAVTDSFALGAITASPTHGDVHHTVSFTAAVSGIPLNPISWRGLPTGCVSHHTNPLVCVPTAPGTSSVTATIIGSFGLAVVSPSLSYTVGTSPAISQYTATKTTLDIGMSTTLTTTVTGGTTPLTYAYSPLPAGCSSANISSLLCAPTAAGNVTVEVTVTDGTGATLTANLTLSVYPTLQVGGLTASPLVVTASVPFHLMVTALGGSPTINYSYSGLPTSCASSYVATLVCTPSIAGIYTVSVNVTDGAGASLSRSTNVTVNALPTVSQFSATPNQLVLGSTVTFAVTASGGTGALTYVYTGLPGGCPTTNSSTVACTPNGTGTFTVTVMVTDSLRVPSAPTSTIVTVTSAKSSSTGVSSVPWWVWVVIALVILVVIVAVLLWVRRSPPPPAASTLSPPAAAPSSTAPPTRWDESSGG
jgi:hypothetical protein